MNDDIPELTEEQFARAIPAHVRKRLMLGQFESGEDIAALRRFSYRPMATEPNMVLTIDPAWQSYEDYLGALDAKYRHS